MKKERQIGLRVGIPALFCMELEEYHKHAQGAHRALSFPDFLGFLVGLGLDAYKKDYRQREGEASESPDVFPEHDRDTAEPYKVDFWDFPDDAPVLRKTEARTAAFRELEEAI
jgi:hypothetical protein